MGLKSRSKGKRGEREIARLARQFGLQARRSWELAQHPDPRMRASDVEIVGRRYEVKRSRDGFRTLYRELEYVAGLFLRADSRQWLAVVPAERLLALVASSNRATDEAAQHVRRRKRAAADSRATCANRGRHCQLKVRKL